MGALAGLGEVVGVRLLDDLEGKGGTGRLASRVDGGWQKKKVGLDIV